MNAYVPYVIFGLATGSIYGLSAMGLVLTYRTSGLLNFGHGAVCAAAAYVFYDMREIHGLSWPLAALIAVLVFGPLSGLVLERMAALLDDVSVTYKIVATVGLLVAVTATVTLIFGGDALYFRTFLPQHTVFTVLGTPVNVEKLIVLGLGLGGSAGLFAFFRYTRLGTAMRGVVDDPQLLAITGETPNRVRRRAWIVGGIFASISGILFASAQQQLDVNILALLVVQTFGAAAIGRFTNIPMAFAGGLIVGVLQKIVSKEVAPHQALQGLDINTPFIVLFILLLVIPRSKLVEVGRVVKTRAIEPSMFSARSRGIGYAGLLGFALAVPAFAGAHLIAWDTAMTQVVLFLSLGLLVRTSGQISLCHIGFAAVGAAGLGHMEAHGVPWLLAVLIGGLITVPLGLIIAVPAIRLSGLYLGLATLGFGILLEEYAYTKSYFFGSSALLTRRPALFGLGGNTRFYYLLLVIALAALALVLVIERSRLGRLLRGLAGSPVALSTLGAEINVCRIVVFAISAFLAGVSGATYASLFGATNQDSFSYVGSLTALAVLAISGRRTITSAAIAAVLLDVVPSYISNPDLNTGLQIVFGVAAIAAAAASQGRFEVFMSRRTAASRERAVGPGSIARTRLVGAAELGPPGIGEPRALSRAAAA